MLQLPPQALTHMDVGDVLEAVQVVEDVHGRHRKPLSPGHDSGTVGACLQGQQGWQHTLCQCCQLLSGTAFSIDYV